MTFGNSRDDITSILPSYLEKKIFNVDPFQVLDQDDVGKLIKTAVEKGCNSRKDLKCGNEDDGKFVIGYGNDGRRLFTIATFRNCCDMTFAPF